MLATGSRPRDARTHGTIANLNARGAERPAAVIALATIM
jgi:hypothetical protein